MIQVYLDNVLYDDPIGWDEFKSKIVRDDTLNALLTYQEASVTFSGAAYEYLYNKILNDGFCDYVNARFILNDCNLSHIINATIFMADIQFNEKLCEAVCKVEDNSFYKQIKNNAKLNTSLVSGKSKNGTDITIPTTYYFDLTDIFNPAIDYKSNIPSIRVYDAFKYLVSYMSDGNLSFTSDLFQSGTWRGLTLAYGYKIFDVTDTREFEISFQKLFDEINRRIPIILIIDNPFSDRPTIRIEANDNSFDTTVIAQHTNIDEIIKACDTTKLYTKVEIGSSVTDDTLVYPFPDSTRFFGFMEEEYNIEGICNIDRNLDLKVDFVTSVNVIYKQVSFQDYNGNIFLIDTDYVTNKTIVSDIFSIGRYYWNYRLNNENILTRYLDGLPGNPIQYFGVVGEGTFFANNTTNQTFGTALLQVEYPATSYNIGGDYNTGTWRFTAPQPAVYSFEVLSNYGVDVAAGAQVYETWYEIYDASNILLQQTRIHQTIPVYGLSYAGSGFFPVVNGWTTTGPLNFQAAMITGDYMVIKVTLNGGIGPFPTTWTGCYFSCLSNTIGGGTFATVNTDDFKIYAYQYEYPLTLSEFDNLVNNASQKISFSSTDQDFREGWIKEILYDYQLGMATIKLITSKNGS
jgi:hypothetical protein